MNLKDRLFQSAVFSIFGRIVAFSIAFIITPFMMQNLGAEGYGLWLLIIAVVGWFRFVDLGFSSAVQRSIAIAIENNDSEKINTIFSCSVVLFSSLGLMAAGFICLLSLFPSLLGVEEQHYTTVTISLLILSVKIFWDLGMSCFHGFYSALIRYDVDANINTANELIKAGLIFVLLSDLNIYGAVIATMAADFLTNIFKIGYARKLYPGFKFEKRLINKLEFKKLFDYSKHVFILVVAASFSKGTDSLIISHLLGLSFVAVYGVAARLVHMIEELLLTVLGLFLPVLTRLIEKQGEVEGEINKVFSLNFLLVSSCFIPLIIFAEDFIFLWLGEGFEQADTIVAAIAMALLCRSISRPVQVLLLAKATHSGLGLVRIIQVVLNILLSIYLGLKFGMLGILIATITSFLICDVFMHLALYRIYTEYSLGAIVSRFFASIVLVVSLSALGHFYLNSLPPLSWIELFAYSGITFVISFLLVWIVIVERSAKHLITSIVVSNLKQYGLWR